MFIGAQTGAILGTTKHDHIIFPCLTKLPGIISNPTWAVTVVVVIKRTPILNKIFCQINLIKSCLHFHQLLFKHWKDDFFRFCGLVFPNLDNQECDLVRQGINLVA